MKSHKELKEEVKRLSEAGHKITACLKCKTPMKAYWLKNGICNGCRNPHLIVKAVKS